MNERTELSELESRVVISVSNGITAAKAAYADALVAARNAEKAIELAEARAQSALSAIVSVRGLDGNWQVSADGSALVRC